jgi:predicted  nucleic acid-binding Zn-ribbon protein
MDPTTEQRREQELEGEIERLRTRLDGLETELVEVQGRANEAVAEWQDRAYWLDRLHIDLNAIMRRPGANQIRIVLKAIRTAFWILRRAKRRLLGP